MAKINEMFKDEIKEISDGISRLTREGCITSYSNYIEQNAAYLPPVENKFILLLRRRRKDFLKKIMKEKYSKYKPTDLLDVTVSFSVEGCYSIEDMIDNDGLESALKEHFNDVDLYEHISLELKVAFNELVTELERTKKQEEINKIKMAIKNTQDCIESNIKHNEKFADTIEELKKKLEELEN